MPQCHIGGCYAWQMLFAICLMSKHFPIHLSVFQNYIEQYFPSDLRKPCCNLVKACLLIKNLVLFLRKLIITSYKQNDKHPSTCLSLPSYMNVPYVCSHFETISIIFELFLA